MVTNIHEEAQEDDIFNAFSKYGEIKNLNLNLDRRTGYVKGYALIEFEEYEQAKKIIKGMQIFIANVQIYFYCLKLKPCL